MKYLTTSALTFLIIYLLSQSGIISNLIGYSTTIVLIVVLAINLIGSVIWFILPAKCKEEFKKWFIEELDKNNENF